MKINKKILTTFSAVVISTSFITPYAFNNSYGLVAKAVESFDRTTSKVGDNVYVEGIITSKHTGAAFFIQTNDSQNIYVYPKNAELKEVNIKKGDKISFTASVSTYKEALQLTGLKNLKVISENNEVNSKEVAIGELNKEYLDSYVSLSDLRVDNIKGTDDSTIILSDNNENKLTLFIKKAIASNDKVKAKVKKGDKINLQAFYVQYGKNYQLSLVDINDIIVNSTTKSAEPLLYTKVKNIGEIQGSDHKSPLVDKNVKLDNVVVTKLNNDQGFYIQDINPDNDIKTSDAIYVASSEKVSVGDKLVIEAGVSEEYGEGYKEKTSTDLTITTLTANKIIKDGTASLPKTIILGDNIPKKIIDNDGLTSFDPTEDAIDFWESIEGMRVEIDKPTILGPQKYGYLYVLPSTYKGERNNSGGISLNSSYQNTEIIAIMTGNRSYRAKAKDYFEENIIGNVTYDYSEYKVDVRNSKLPKKQDGKLEREKSNITFDENKLTVASYNIENFSANSAKKETPDKKVEKIAKSFINEINSPDIISLIEVQDNNGTVNDGTTNGMESGERLANKIKELGGVSYKYIEIAPENNQDGGAPGGNIRVAFLYNPDRVKLTEKDFGNTMDEAKFENGELLKNPSRISPKSKAFKGTRKSLAAEFDFKGEKVIVIANHLKSKNGDNPLYGKIQPAVETSQKVRLEQAKEILNFVDSGLQQNPDMKFILTGDFNDFEFSKTISSLKEGHKLVDLLSQHDKEDRYSYFYRGNNQSLDNILVSSNLAEKVKFDAIHVNSSFMEEDGRASDHDPLLLQVDLLAKKADSITDTIAEEKNMENNTNSEKVKEENNIAKNREKNKKLAKTGIFSENYSLLGILIILSLLYVKKLRKYFK